MSQHRILAALAPLFLVVFIDALGMGILYPVITPLFLDPNQGLLPATASMFQRELTYGILMGLFPLATFFMAPILGDASDKKGRKNIIIVCLLGSFVGYMLLAIGIVQNSVALMMLGRLLDGASAGNIPIAQAAIIDVSPENRKANFLSFILLAVTLGFVAGPIVGTILIDKSLVSWFSYSLPMYFAAGLSLFNAIFLYLAFHETHESHGKISFQLTKAFHLFVDAFSRKSLRSLSLIFFLHMFGWACVYQFLSIFLMQKFHFTGHDVGWYLGLMAVGFAIGQLFVVHVMTYYFSLRMTTALMLMLVVVGIFVTFTTTNTLALWIIAPIGTTGASVAYTTFITMYSNTVDSEHQGWIMGVSSAVINLAWGIAGPVSALLGDVDLHVPIIVGFVLNAVAVLIILMSRARSKRPT